MGNQYSQLEHSQPEPVGRKDDAGKEPLSLIDNYAMRQLGAVLAFGKNKYAAHNWRGGIEYSRVLDAALRHLTAFNDGEDLDQESGLSHVAHAMCNCMFLLNFTKTHPEKDDRYKRPVHPQANAVGGPFGGLMDGAANYLGGIAGLASRHVG